MSDKKVVLLSTRKIQEEGIFKSFKRCDVNSTLLKFFRTVNKDDFEKIDVLNNCSAYPNDDKESFNKEFNDWKKDLKTFLNSTTPDSKKIIYSLRETPKQLLMYVASLSIGERSFLEKGKELLEKYNKIEQEQEQNSEKPYLDQAFLEKPCTINIDTVKAKTVVADRISLFRFPKHHEDYAVYAVWPLNDSCEDDLWVDCLTNAVIEQEHNCNELILWLHDNDLKSTEGNIFHVIYYQREIELDRRKIKRSLGVFQHPDMAFNNVLNAKLYDEKSIFEAVDMLFSKIYKMRRCDKENILAKIYESKLPVK